MDKKIIIIILVGFIALATGWTAGSSFSYQKGYDLARKQQEKTILSQIADEKLVQNVRPLYHVVQDGREELLVRYTGRLEKDFITIFATHQKMVGDLCKAYAKNGADKSILAYCEKTIIPSVFANRAWAESYLENSGQ